MESILYTILSACGTVFPMRAVQGQNAPFMVYQVISDLPSMVKNESSRLDTARVQVSIFGATVSQVHSLYTAVRAAMDRYSDTTIQHITFSGFNDLFDDEAELYHRAVDFMVRVHQ